MNFDSFIGLIKKKKEFPTHMGGSWSSDGIILSSTYNGVPWEFRGKLADEVADIDFGCCFENNSCIKEREDPAPLFFTPAVSLHVNYCCSRCFQTIGNTIILPPDENILKQIAELFEETSMGFWRPAVGCTLPPIYRSTMCLTGRCDYIVKKHNLSREDLMKLWRLTNIKQIWKTEREKNV